MPKHAEKTKYETLLDRTVVWIFSLYILARGLGHCREQLAYLSQQTSVTINSNDFIIQLYIFDVLIIEVFETHYRQQNWAVFLFIWFVRFFTPHDPYYPPFLPFSRSPTTTLKTQTHVLQEFSSIYTQNLQNLRESLTNLNSL